ncbi:MAG: hypothetical protein ACK5X3_10675, partial [Pseudomonadota bacterium]
HAEWQEADRQGDCTMSPTKQQIVAEAERRAREGGYMDKTAYLVIDVVRENWTPPEPVLDPDVWAFREWASNKYPTVAHMYRSGIYDAGDGAQCFLAGVRMATERERERAKVLLRGLEDIVDADQDEISHMALDTMVKYREAL